MEEDLLKITWMGVNEAWDGRVWCRKPDRPIAHELSNMAKLIEEGRGLGPSEAQRSQGCHCWDWWL
jgi:hypothetical protein